MKITQIEQEVLSGNLILEKTYMGKRSKIKYLWDEKGEHINGHEKIVYDSWLHKAMIKGTNQGYKISKKVYNNLIKQLAK